MKWKHKIYIAFFVGLLMLLGLCKFYIWGSIYPSIDSAFYSIYILSAYTSIITFILSKKTNLIESIKKNIFITLMTSIFATLVYGIEITFFVQNNYAPYWDWKKDWPEFLKIILKTSIYSIVIAMLATWFCYIIKNKVLFDKNKRLEKPNWKYRIKAGLIAGSIVYILTFYFIYFLSKQPAITDVSLSLSLRPWWRLDNWIISLIFALPFFLIFASIGTYANKNHQS